MGEACLRNVGFIVQKEDRSPSTLLLALLLAALRVLRITLTLARNQTHSPARLVQLQDRGVGQVLGLFFREKVPVHRQYIPRLLFAYEWVYDCMNEYMSGVVCGCKSVCTNAYVL